MFEIRSLHPAPFARVVMLLLAVVHVLAGIGATLLFMVLRSVFSGSFLATGVSSLTLFLFWLAGLVIIMPLGYLLGLLLAACYNLFASWWGGVALNLMVTKREELSKTEGLEKKEEQQRKGGKGEK